LVTEFGSLGVLQARPDRKYPASAAKKKRKDAMSIDRSLKITANLSGKRSVLTRAERIEKLKTDKKWDEKKNTALNIPKTLVGK